MPIGRHPSPLSTRNKPRPPSAACRIRARIVASRLGLSTDASLEKGIVELPALADSKVRPVDAEVAAIKAQIGSSLASAAVSDTPYRHWTLSHLFPETIVEALFD